MFYLHHSNHLDSLAQEFADVHASRSADPFLPEHIIVQNAGMARWLSLRISEQLGIAANLQFVFPAEYMWQLIRTVLNGLPDVEPFRPGILRWRIVQILANHADEFPELSSYLQDDNQLRSYQLACRLEEMLDRCLFYRPQWIIDWENRNTPHWQARLWRKLVDGDGTHWVGLQQQFMQALTTKHADLSGQRVLIFGIAQLSPGYLQLLREAARYMDVHFFLMNPCQQYWGDIVADKIKIQSDDAVAEYLEVGNPLLASMGRQGRDFFELLIELEPDAEQTCFAENQADSILSVIQNDVLNLNNPSEKSSNLTMDGSISIHSCHTPMREVEVLYDQLLDLINHDPYLKPEQIIVMMPSVQTYAPFVEAVFASGEHQIPYVIADRNLTETNIVAEILSVLLEIPDSRFEVNRVLALLDYEPVRQHFNLNEDDISQIREWCIQTNIRWGIDATMRQSLDLPNTLEHSWLAGIQRMLLGSVMNSDALFNDILPYTQIEGSLTILLGRFVEFAQRLFELREWNQQQCSLHAWIEQIRSLLNLMILDNDQQRSDLNEIDNQLNQLVYQSEQAGYTAEISFPFIKELLLGVLENCSQQEHFASGGVTFCELTPMRSVPFKVVCLIGMSDGQFPKPTSQHSFDLLAEDGYRRGDRSRRTEERYLFLESLLAAREKLYISYVGRDVRKNTEIPPSVLVSELLDCVEKTFEIDCQQLVTEHPLQAFSTRYYEISNDLFTYTDFPIVRQTTEQEPAFVTTELEKLPVTELSLRELIRFIRFPVRYFLEQKLGIKPEQVIGELPEREPFELEIFRDVELRQAIFHQFEEPQNDIIKRLRAQGLLPHGTEGQRIFEQERQVVSDLIDRSAEITATQSIVVQQQLDSVLLYGTLENVTQQGIVIVSFGKIWKQDILEHWLNHLALAITKPDNTVIKTTIIHPQGESSFDSVDDPQEHLAVLLKAYMTGTNTPLHFIPKTAYEYASILADPKSKKNPEKALDSAKKIWTGNQHSSGEGQKEAYQLAFRGIDVFDEQFEYWAKMVWMPILECFQE
ncbi:MAG: exodeoxyribonuclease V subunit gamma [Methylococcales bacterium]